MIFVKVFFFYLLLSLFYFDFRGLNLIKIYGAFYRANLVCLERDLKNQNAAQTHDALGGEYFLFAVLLYERDYLSSEKSGSQAGRRVGSWL